MKSSRYWNICPYLMEVISINIIKGYKYVLPLWTSTIIYRRRSLYKGSNPKHHAGETSQLSRRRERLETPNQRIPQDISYQRLETFQILSRNISNGPSIKRWLQELQSDRRWRLTGDLIIPVHMRKLRFSAMVYSSSFVGAVLDTPNNQDLQPGRTADGLGIMVSWLGVSKNNLSFDRYKQWLKYKTPICTPAKKKSLLKYATHWSEQI